MAVNPSAMQISGKQLPADVAASLRAASQRTGVDFAFLVAQASLESGFDAKARASNSSASGLFQFTGQTWMTMMREHGAKYGYGDLARTIHDQGDGTLGASDPAAQKKILDLRKNVELAANMAAEYAKENGRYIAHAMGRHANAADLHLAHLLGPAGAVRFLKARASDGETSAVDLMPAAARQNPSLFYEHGQTAQSVAAVYRQIEQRIGTPIRQVVAYEPAALKPGIGISDSMSAKGKG